MTCCSWWQCWGKPAVFMQPRVQVLPQECVQQARQAKCLDMQEAATAARVAALANAQEQLQSNVTELQVRLVLALDSCDARNSWVALHESSLRT